MSKTLSATWVVASVVYVLPSTRRFVMNSLAGLGEAFGGGEVPGVAELESLIASFRDDMDVDVTVSIEGTPRALPADAGLALYRGAQEALTNIARYAPGATTVVVLRYTQNQTALMVEDRDPSASPIREGLKDVGGGRGLAGLRERVERVGGSLEAGPTESGWRVEVVVPS